MAMNDLLKALLVSGSLGALIGLERQWERQLGHPDRHIPAGVRTFALWAILGTVCAFLSRTSGGFVFVAGLLAMIVWLGIFLFYRGRDRAGAGFTTAATGLLTYLLGGLVVAGEARSALVLTVVTLILLTGQNSLHSISQKFTTADVRMALQFLAVTGAVLPLVPDQSFGPYGAFNPRSVWLMVVIVSGLGFAGYVAVRIFGAPRGIVLTGIAGGLASSTATTLSMAKLSRSQPALSADCALALVLACTVMLWRVETLILAISPELALALIPDLVLMSIPGAVFALRRTVGRSPGETSPDAYKNPLSLRVAIQFGALYAVVVFIVKLSVATFGNTGLLVASFLSGLTDLDAISLTLSNLFRNSGIPMVLAAQGIVLAAAANSLLKAALAAGLGSSQLRRSASALLTLIALIGAGTILARSFLIP
jgi:uncharacterized membrane protein (DUF4010 family)